MWAVNDDFPALWRCSARSFAACTLGVLHQTFHLSHLFKGTTNITKQNLDNCKCQQQQCSSKHTTTPIFKLTKAVKEKDGQLLSKLTTQYTTIYSVKSLLNIVILIVLLQDTTPSPPHPPTGTHTQTAVKFKSYTGVRTLQ